ncbi:hypothetical protein DFQ28_004717 [Apophysomyces sp. BC1034]|nr:hypothetical protein DFQ30_008621 [Apophysomyces sp. BC1015]KAG0181020.1 hypothetical protein DFQ29_009554 [Apophysomyces sp. BC1021]KAG0188534.1 hypothetical protein DFQ28_004717 [Apophysomyces sp. BC1034]
MEQTSTDIKILSHPLPDSLADDYEYRVYDNGMYNALTECGPCPVVFMSRHQGFQWNEELFVGVYRRDAGFECYKSNGRQRREEKVLNAVKAKNREVVDINLSKADSDIWP